MEILREKGTAADAKPILANFQHSERSRTPLNTSMQEYVVPLAGGAKAIFQWPASLTDDDIEDLKDSLKILERKITRPLKPITNTVAE